METNVTATLAELRSGNYGLERIEEVESELMRVLMGECGGFIDSQVDRGRMQGSS